MTRLLAQMQTDLRRTLGQPKQTRSVQMGIAVHKALAKQCLAPTPEQCKMRTIDIERVTLDCANALDDIHEQVSNGATINELSFWTGIRL